MQTSLNGINPKRASTAVFSYSEDNIDMVSLNKPCKKTRNILSLVILSYIYVCVLCMYVYLYIYICIYIMKYTGLEIMNQGIEKYITYISLLYFLLYGLNWIYLIKISHCHAWVCLGYCVSSFLSVITLTAFVKGINLPFRFCQNLHSDNSIFV